MPRFIGVKGKEIKIVSDSIFHNDDLRVIEVPKELDSVNSSDLIVDYQFKNNQIISKNGKKDLSQLKVALVSNWKIKCGISTYAESLWTQIIPKLNDYKLFIEDNEFISPINELPGISIPDDRISICWKRGHSLKQLTEEIKKYDPDIVWIQHEFGLWSNARYWLALMNQLSDYRVIVTMHSVFHHRDKTICEAAIPEIVVHLEGAIKVLKEEKGVPGKIYSIPHGCDPCVSTEKLWNFYKTEHTFMQFGFGFRYKNWQNSIKAVAILKNKYPDVFFTGLFSESPFNKTDHQIYYNELMSLVHELDIQENVAIIRGFQSDNSLDSYLRTNCVAVFPYNSNPEHEVFGASGAARLAMSKAIPVITSKVNHFSDLPTIKADTPEEIAQELDNLFSSRKNQEKQIASQLEYLSENTWEKVAQQYLQLFIK